MVSMKDIARECNVSVATVSKALNGYSDIGKEKREEIQRVAQAMGYFPNSSARALKTNRTYNLGVLLSDASQSGLTHDYFAAILDSFKTTAERSGYDLTFTTRSTVANRRMTYYEHARYRGLDGIVIACIDFDDPEVQELIHSSLPVVTIDHIFDGRISVCSDNVAGIHDLTEYIISQGHRKIAYVHGDDTSVTRDRIASFYRTMAMHGLEVPNRFLRPSQYRDIPDTEKEVAALLEMSDRPSCILLPDDYAAIGAIHAIQKKGFRIPEDISIAGYDGLKYSSILSPELTTYHQDTATIGQKAADALISLIENPRTTLIEKIQVEGNLVPGESIKKLL